MGCTLSGDFVEFFVIFIIGKFSFLYIVVSFPDVYNISNNVSSTIQIMITLFPSSSCLAVY